MANEDKPREDKDVEKKSKTDDISNSENASIKSKGSGTEDVKTKDDKNKQDENIGNKMKEVINQQQEEISEVEEPIFYERKVKVDEYSIWNFDLWIDEKTKNCNFIIKIIMEISVIALIFLGPSGFWIYKNINNITLSKYFESPGELKDDQESLFRLGLFVTLCITFERFISLVNDNLLSIIGFVLNNLYLDDSEIIWKIMDNLSTSSPFLKKSLIVLAVYKLSNIMFSPFEKPDIFNFFNINTIKAIALIYSVYLGIMFMMKFFVYILIYDIKKSSYSSNICDLNQKLFIFIKLKSISETKEGHDVDDIINNMNPSYDPGFYLIDGDFFESKEDAKIIAQNIMALLKISKLTYDNTKIYFPNNHENIFKYLTGIDELNKKAVINVNQFKRTAADLFEKRSQMSRTLRDRNSIFEKLEFIFSMMVRYITAIIACYIFEIDYKIYLTSFGTSLLTVSWIFADVIKEVFKCFIFILIIRPFDIGDWVNIDGEDYIVRKIDLVNTTFLTSLDKLIYISNLYLIGTKIQNYARSPPESFRLELLVDSETSYKSAIDLKKAVEPEIKKMKKYFSEVKFLEICDGKLSYAIMTPHNFQNIDLTRRKKEKLIGVFEDAMVKSGIKYKNSFQFKC